MMRFKAVEIIIYGYVFICFTLLIYNLIYIFKSGTGRQKQERRAEKWMDEIEKQIACLQEGKRAEKEHIRQMEKSLSVTSELISYGMALERLKEKDSEQMKVYLLEVQGTLQYLASVYAKKDSMDRAYFAYMISCNHPYCGEEFRPVMEILIAYLDDSTVYCRENVLNALYALGNIQSVENALQIFQDRGLFHHQKLLTDGLLTFQGNKDKLAERLWSHYGQWNGNIMLSVLQFITGFSGRYRETFLPLLNKGGHELEIRLAVLRYYRRHPYAGALPLILDCLEDEEESLAIVAASVLDRYPGSRTVEALKKSLHHPNWYVRYNGAASLAALGIRLEALRDILEGNDRYAREMLAYMLKDQREGGMS